MLERQGDCHRCPLATWATSREFRVCDPFRGEAFTGIGRSDPAPVTYPPLRSVGSERREWNAERLRGGEELERLVPPEEERYRGEMEGIECAHRNGKGLKDPL